MTVRGKQDRRVRTLPTALIDDVGRVPPVRINQAPSDLHRRAVIASPLSNRLKELLHNARVSKKSGQVQRRQHLRSPRLSNVHRAAKFV